MLCSKRIKEFSFKAKSYILGFKNSIKKSLNYKERNHLNSLEMMLPKLVMICSIGLTLYWKNKVLWAQRIVLRQLQYLWTAINLIKEILRSFSESNQRNSKKTRMTNKFLMRRINKLTWSNPPMVFLNLI
jgi:hypothetical protein